MRFLIVDEDLEIERLVLVLQARRPEHSFDLADTLGDAKEMLWHQQYDAIAMDVWMPPDETAVPGSSEDSGLVSGLMLIELMSGDKKCVNRETPLLVFTGLVPQQHPRVNRYQEENSDRFLQKPLHPDDFFDELERTAKEKT